LKEALEVQDKTTYEAMLNILEDIEESNKQLKKEKEKAQTFLNIAGTIFVILDDKGKVKFINKKGCEAFGLSSSKITGRLWFSRFPKKEAQELEGKYRAFIHNENDNFAHFRGSIKTRSGERIIDWNNVLFHDEEGVSVILAGSDLTRELKAFKSLDTERRFKESVIENAGVPILVFNEKGNTIIANNAFQDTTGYKFSEVETLDKLLKLACPEKMVKEKIKKAIKATYKKGSATDIVFPILTKNDLTTIFVANFSTIRDNHNKIVNLAMFLRDLSEIFDLEEQVRHCAANGFTQKSHINEKNNNKRKIEISEVK